MSTFKSSTVALLIYLFVYLFCSSSTQAALYGQIVKWFQNHAYMEQNLCEGKTKAKKLCVPEESDDEEAGKLHLSELQKELKKNKFDYDKVARLLSLTFAHRRHEMAADTATTRIGEVLKRFSCLKKPIYVRQ